MLINVPEEYIKWLTDPETPLVDVEGMDKIDRELAIEQKLLAVLLEYQGEVEGRRDE